MSGSMCTDCLDEWDRQGVNYLTQAIHTTVVVGGDSKCVTHYREWRDRNLPPVVDAVQQALPPAKG